MNDDKIKKAENETNLNPTELQKKEGNYKKGKVTICGLKITIENPVNSIRSGKDSNGNEWEIKVPYTYGYFNGTVGKDGDQIDVYLGSCLGEFDVYIIDQVFENSGAFDEHKIMFGFSNQANAKSAYLECYEDGWKGFGNITKISLRKFKLWLNDMSMNKYPASKLSASYKMDIKNVDLGERISKIRMFGEVESNKTLKDLIAQAGDENDFDKLIVEIASPGGSVSEGLEIMMWLDGLSLRGKQIITVVVANAYSIASLIMLSANMKLISKHGKVMVHNPMVPELKYVNANDLEEHISELRELEGAMYDLYEMFTGLDKEQIKGLMDQETYLSPQEAVDLGFADMVVDIKPRSFEMTTNKLKKTNMSKTINTLNKVMAMVNQSDYVNQTYSEESGAEIEIFQADPSTYKKGDRTSLEKGVVTLTDGAKITTEDFIITEIDRSIDPAIEEVDASFNEGDAPDVEVVEPVVEVVESVEDPIVEPKADPSKVIEKTESTVTTKEIQNAEITEIIKWDSTVVNETFALKDKVLYKGMDGDEDYSVGAGEYELEDGRKILTDSEGIIQFIKPAMEVAEAKVEAKVNEEIVDKAMEKKLEALEIKNKELEAKLGEIENKFNEGSKDVENKLNEVNKFQEVAAQAIDTVASSMTSNFSPEARASVGLTPKGSIFSQLKQKRGLV